MEVKEKDAKLNLVVDRLEVFGKDIDLVLTMWGVVSILRCLFVLLIRMVCPIARGS